MFYRLRLNYYSSLYFDELKTVADSNSEIIKDSFLKMGSRNLIKMFEIAKKIHINNKHYSHKQFLNEYFVDGQAIKSWIVKKYGIETYKLYLQAGDLEEKTSEAVNTNESKKDVDRRNYANEIQKHLLDLSCTFTTAGHVSAMILRQDRSPLDQAISFCIGAIAENYFKNLICLAMNGHTHLSTVSSKIKNYYENGKISKLAYQSTISVLGSCLNPNKTDEEKEVLESLIKQNYLGNEKLVSITE